MMLTGWMRFYFLATLIFFNATTAFSQQLKILSYAATPPDFLNLLKSNAEIRDSTTLNESVVDLANVFLTDSVLPRKFERHQLAVVGGFTRMVGKRWLSINGRKEKYVGSAKNGFRIPGDKEHFTEYDVNINLVPHLRRYIDLAYRAFQRQKEIGRHKKKHDYYRNPPFVYPDAGADLSKYDLHCELSPPRGYRSMINELVYPIIAGNSATKHQHFGDENFTVGLYGAYISDCNHSCHPEIHPYEWLWWLNVHPETDNEPLAKTWVFGLFREGSNRFPKWSPSPRTGGIEIPFVFPVKEKQLVIDWKHLVFSRFSKEGFRKLNIPADAMGFDQQEWRFSFEDPAINDVSIILKTNAPIIQNEIKFWFSELNFDVEKLLISGKLHVATSVDDLYTAKVKFSY